MSAPTPRTDAPLRLKLRDTGLYDDLGGLGQRIWTTAGQGYAKTEFVEAWALEQTQRELSAARAELAQEREKVEHLQVQLAGCGVASMSNTREALTRAREATGQYGDSASYQDCLRAVEREIEERERAERAEAREKAIANLLAHLPENWGDQVIEGKMLLLVDAWAIDAAIAEGKKNG